jgi:hypothetical protein
MRAGGKVDKSDMKEWEVWAPGIAFVPARKWHGYTVLEDSSVIGSVFNYKEGF